MTDDAFGFAAARNKTADKLKTIRPSEGPPTPAKLDTIDAAGESLGFRSREREIPSRSGGRRRELGPTLAINTRAPERVAIPFIKFCDENRYTYWEGLEELMRRAGVS